MTGQKTDQKTNQMTNQIWNQKGCFPNHGFQICFQKGRMRSLRRDQLRFAARSINIPISTLIDQACRQSHRGRGCVFQNQKSYQNANQIWKAYLVRHLVRFLVRFLVRHLDCTRAVTNKVITKYSHGRLEDNVK